MQREAGWVVAACGLAVSKHAAMIPPPSAHTVNAKPDLTPPSYKVACKSAGHMLSCARVVDIDADSVKAGRGLVRSDLILDRHMWSCSQPSRICCCPSSELEKEHDRIGRYSC